MREQKCQGVEMRSVEKCGKKRDERGFLEVLLAGGGIDRARLSAMAAVSGSPTQVPTSVSSAAQLSAVPVGAFKNGELGAVRQGTDLPTYYALLTESTATPDGVNILYAAGADPAQGGSGPGRWHILPLSTASAVSSSFVYQPGGPASGNIFNDPWALALAVFAAGVPVDVYISCANQSPAPWPVDIFLPNARFFASPVTNTPAVLQLTKGTSPFGGTPTDGKLWFPSVLDGVTVALGNATPDAMVTVGQIFGQRLEMKNGASIVRTNDASPPALFITGAPLFELDIDNCQAPFANLADPTASNVQFLGNTLLVRVTGVAPGFSMPPFTGGAGAILQIHYDASVPVSQVSPQPDWAGLVLPAAIDNAGGVAYAPSVLANWSGVAPSSTANALDRIAAKIGPIP